MGPKRMPCSYENTTESTPQMIKNLFGKWNYEAPFWSYVNLTLGNLGHYLIQWGEKWQFLLFYAKRIWGCNYGLN